MIGDFEVKKAKTVHHDFTKIWRGKVTVRMKIFLHINGVFSYTLPSQWNHIFEREIGKAKIFC